MSRKSNPDKAIFSKPQFRMVIVKTILALVLCLGAVGPTLAADLVVAMPNWPSGQVTANIIKAALQKNLNLDVDVREMGTMTAFAGLASGEIDVHPEV